MLGKHLRKLANILTSLRITKFTVTANILTLGIAVVVLAIVLSCNAVHRDRQRSLIIKFSTIIGNIMMDGSMYRVIYSFERQVQTILLFYF
jgi:hypothetical protein